MDEITDNILFSYERTNPDLKTGFYSAQSCKDLPYSELTIRIRTEEQLCDNTEAETTSDTSTTTSTPSTTKKEDIVPDTSEYKYYQMGDPMLDFSNKTIVTDNDPNFVIIKNGPGPIIKSSYPYIKTYYGASYGYADIFAHEITLTIRSTDYYGCPYQVTINGIDYTFEVRMYDSTNPDTDSSSWHCWLTDDINSPDCWIDIYGKADKISMTGSLIHAHFTTADEFADPSILERYPKND